MFVCVCVCAVWLGTFFHAVLKYVQILVTEQKKIAFVTSKEKEVFWLSSHFTGNTYITGIVVYKSEYHNTIMIIYFNIVYDKEIHLK